MRIRFVVSTSTAAVLAALVSTSTAFAQSPPAIGAAAPPPDAKALVAGPKGPSDAPAIVKPSSDETNAALSAGGLITTGNSKTTALTLNGQFDARRGDNAFLVGVLGNYGESTVAPNPSKATAQNIQGKLRYDRYFLDNLAGFLLVTGRHDKFQGLAFRLNLDPGLKVVIAKDEVQSFWAEGGYDFQFDARNDAGINPVDSAGNPLPKLDPTRIDHSGRAFVGYRRNFNNAVTFSTGIELLQSFVKTDIVDYDTRLNFDANVAAKLDWGFSLGLGFSARYDRKPIGDREQLDTSTTVSLIYAWSDAAPKKAEPPPPPPCPTCPTCPPPPAPEPAPAATTPAPGAATVPAAPAPTVEAAPAAAPTSTPTTTPAPAKP